MTGHCSGHGYLRRFPISDLTHHDDVGVLPKDGPQCRRKGESCLGIHLYLVGTGQSVFHRIFQCHQVPALPVQLGHGSEQGAALPAPGGARRQDDTLPVFHDFPDSTEVRVGEAQVIQAAGCLFRIEDSAHGLFPALYGERGDPEGKSVVAPLQRHTSVLGSPLH